MRDSHLSPFLAHESIESVRCEPALDELLRHEIVDASVATTGAIAWARRSPGGFRIALGEVCAPDVAARPIFDLASVTKPLTALVALRAVAEKACSLATCVGDVLPELAGSALGGATLELLLAHRASAPAWGALHRHQPFASAAPVSLPPDDPEPDLATLLARAASRALPSRAGGETSVYSDIGYVLVGAMLARVLGSPLAEAWWSLCGIGDARGTRAREPAFDARVAPTERSEFRGVVRGEVHDENAWALERAGGSAGHAGAFATVEQVMMLAIRFHESLAGRDPLLPRPLANAMIAERPGGTHRLGWDGRSETGSSSGERFSARAFGHLGFTGTSVWIDPEAEAIAVLLTNRTWPSRDNVRIREARPRVHDALWAIEP